jgi:hypothetical protein
MSQTRPSRPRLATAADFEAFFHREPPPVWTGLVTEEDGEIVGAGIVQWDDYGRAWGSYSARKPLPVVTMHRAALRMLAALEAVEEPVLYVGRDQRVPGSEAWLQRLGFVRVPEMDTDPNFPVWERRWQISE